MAGVGAVVLFGGRPAAVQCLSGREEPLASSQTWCNVRPVLEQCGVRAVSPGAETLKACIAISISADLARQTAGAAPPSASMPSSHLCVTTQRCCCDCDLVRGGFSGKSLSHRRVDRKVGWRTSAGHVCRDYISRCSHISPQQTLCLPMCLTYQGVFTCSCPRLAVSRLARAQNGMAAAWRCIAMHAV